MAYERTGLRGEVVGPPSKRSGSMLRQRRIRIALWIAVVEGIIVALSPDISRWTVILLAIPALALYFWGSRHTRSPLMKDIFWVLAASQSLAIVVAVLAFFLKWFVLALAAVFAIVALYLLYNDRH